MASSESVFLAEVLPEIQSLLRAGECVRIYPKGVSMEPMLSGGRDSVLLSAPPAKLKRYDLALYRRANGQFVLHRVVRARDGRYDFCGDSQFNVEKCVSREQIIAVAVGFRRRGRDVSCGSLTYGLYCRLWCVSRPLRRQLSRLRCAIKRGAIK